ncbi:MAG: SusC/RagA family TonB-linked outer membrane protein [Calditrichaeota bacterium]|nr:SusC/RagA family TonB-linked outer membrane protein [Calditrichota bacterium]
MRSFSRAFLIVWMSIAVSLLCFGAALAQEGAVIKGVVTDDAGNPLPGANIYIEELQLGASADVDGYYMFEIPAELVNGQEVTLVANFLGYKISKQKITLTAGEFTYNFELVPDVLELQEIVVTGMGVGIPKEKLGVVIPKVQPREVVESGEQNIVAALHGKVANVEIIAASGEPGAEAYIRIRGANTIQGNNQPLIVVDGTPINNQSIAGAVGRHGGVTQTNRASDIDPDDIESIEILKGAAASAIYGTRAASGVILITTKSGKPGKPKFTYKVSYSWDEVYNTVPLQKKYGQGVFGRPSTRSPLSWGPRLDTLTTDYLRNAGFVDEKGNLTYGTKVYDHEWEMFEVGHNFDNQFIVSGGNAWTTYYLSIGRTSIDGAIKGNSDYLRNSVHLKATQRLSEKLSVTGNFNYSDVTVNRIQKGSNVSGLLLGTFRTPPNFNNLPYIDPETGLHRSYRYQRPTKLYRSRGYDNPFFIVYENVNVSDVGRAFGNIKLEYDPLDWLNISYTLGTDYSTDDRRTVYPPSSSSYPEGRVIREKFTYKETDGYLAITATRRFEPASANVNVLLGHQINQREFNTFQTIGDKMFVYGFNQLDNTASYDPNEYEYKIRQESFFGQVMLDLWEQLYLSASLRNDGSSTFGRAKKRHWFPKFSGAWEFSSFEMLKPVKKVLSYGKVRVAYGETGREPGAYQTITLYSTGSFGQGWGVSHSTTAFGFGGFFLSATKGNDAIRPERNKEWEYGLDLGFLNNRIGLEITRYESRTEDVILALPVPPSTGFMSRLENAAVIENKGWEIALDAQPIKLKNFKWDVRLLYGENNSLVTDLAGAEYVLLGGFTSAAAYAVVGQPYGVIQGRDFVRFGRGEVVNGVNIDKEYTGWKPGDLYIAEDGYPVRSSKLWVIGDPNPDWTGSIRNTFTLFNNLRISVLFDIKQGGDMWNGTRGALYFFGAHKDTEKPFPEDLVVKMDDSKREGTGVFKGVGPGAGKEVPGGIWWYLLNEGSGFTGPASQFVEDASYMKLREISISYKFRHELISKWIGIKDINIRFTGRNLYTWTNYRGIDPETNLAGNTNWQGLDYFNMPQTRSFILSLQFNY